jgi:CBS domain-containing protein
LRQTKISRALSGVEVQDIMTREVRTVGPDLSLKDLVEDYFSRYKHGGYPVTKGSTLLGLVTIEDVQEVPEAEWSDTRTADVMTPCEELVCLKPEEQALDAFIKMSKAGIGRLPVREKEELVGIVTRSDILHSVRVRTDLVT